MQLWRFLFVVIVIAAAALVTALLLLGPRETAETTYVVRDWQDLEGWPDDDLGAALQTFAHSCAASPWERARDIEGLVIEAAAAWKENCAAVADWPADDARAFFEAHFTPVEIESAGEASGFFTGYFEPLLDGSRTQSDVYDVPLYRHPDDLIAVELGAFRDDLAGRRIAGRVEGRRLVPYADRAQIDAGALAGRDLELVWVDDAVEAFFLHIQGSGRVALEGGGELSVAYAGQNGHPYRAIGAVLIERGEVAREDMSLERIVDWLRANPEEADALMAENPSYIFFRELEGAGPVGSLGVALTPERSLAVDRRETPLGLPVWIETEVDDGSETTPYRRLLIAQDTGGAINGAGRGDIFFGAGARARRLAGNQKMPGRFIVLVPKQALS